MFTFTKPKVAPDSDRCTSVVEAQAKHARGVNDCRSRAMRYKPDGTPFCYQKDHFLREAYKGGAA